MLPPQVRRTSLCLFCAFAFTARSRPQPQRLLSRIQAAQRATSSKNKRRGTPNPLASSPLASNHALRIASHTSGIPPDRIVGEQLRKLKKELAEPEFLNSLQLSRDEFDREWLVFEKAIELWTRRSPLELQPLTNEAKRGKNSLQTRLRHLFYAQTYDSRFTAAELENQKKVADLRHPAEWYPATREIPRTIHMHVGPTNSGKTYHALKRLEQVDSGIYLGPLRLLAHEVYTRLNAVAKPCALITGEEQRMPEGDGAHMYSCTVEMAPLNTKFDVAVIDEIQMINHPDRGWAWTQAFLGLQAKEIHLCGEARTVPLMRQLCALAGDKVHVHEYNRLTPLKVEPQSLNGKLERLEKGDCIVAFSVLGIHALSREVEKKTGKKCAIVYGSLPPETRAQQARLFNDPDNDYDYLVASDAIGMGLNLAIKRVIFESTMKNNGLRYVPLQISEVKQIAGRAGRYKTAQDAVTRDSAEASVADKAVDPVIGLDDTPAKAPESKTIGWVTTLDPVDHRSLTMGMEREPEEIKTAGLFPPSLIIERFANYFPPGTPFTYIMLRLHEMSDLHPRFHLCALKDQLAIADAIHTVENLTVQDRITICAAPINMRAMPERLFLRSLAECIADGKSGNLLHLERLPLSIMDEPPSPERRYLSQLEQLHKMIVCYLWLSYRFPNVFTTRSLANHTKKLVEDQIEDTLTKFSHTEQVRARQKKSRDQARKDMTTNPADADIEVQGHEAKDMLNDPELATDVTCTTNDGNEYPDDLPVDKLDSLATKHGKRSTKLSEEVRELVKSRGLDSAKQNESMQ